VADIRDSAAADTQDWAVADVRDRAVVDVVSAWGGEDLAG
jgi:hypothetical protein